MLLAPHVSSTEVIVVARMRRVAATRGAAPVVCGWAEEEARRVFRSTGDDVEAINAGLSLIVDIERNLAEHRRPASSSALADAIDSLIDRPGFWLFLYSIAVALVLARIAGVLS